MARIRTIKPEFWTDEKLSECSLSARLLFIGLISHADDEGRLEHSPARLRMQVFPCGSVKPAQITEWLGELRERSLIRLYVVDGREFLDVPNFAKHQRINRPTPSKLPPFREGTHLALSEDSVSPTAGREGKGKEGKGAKRERALPATRRVPDSFAVTPELRSWAGTNHPTVNVDRQTALMRDYEFRRPYSDWPAVWRRWISRAAESMPSVTNGHVPKASSVDADGIPTWATPEERAELLRLRAQEIARADH